MTAHSVEDFLRGLTGGMPLETFNDEVRERRLAHFKSTIEPTVLDSVFSLPRLEHLLRRDNLLTPYVEWFDRLLRRGGPVFVKAQRRVAVGNGQ